MFKLGLLHCGLTTLLRTLQDNQISKKILNDSRVIQKEIVQDTFHQFAFKSYLFLHDTNLKSAR